MREVVKLRQVNSDELATLRIALETLLASKCSYSRYTWLAKDMLEDDAKFVRALFWAS